MALKLAVIALLAVSVQCMSEELKELYHTSESVDSEIISLAKTCEGMKVVHHKGENDKNTVLTAVSLKRQGGAAKKLKVLLFFGEHSRELVSVESGLSLIQHLCGQSKGLPVPKDLVNYSLQNAEFLIFTNIGVNSRKHVEKGEYCLRVNNNKVDLNRNWADHWSDKRDDPETSPGKKPFSEDETKILRDASKEFRPDLFLTVHSGTLGMYIPYAFSEDEVPGKSTPQMLDILNKMNPKYCNCDVGAAGKQVGYLCPGTCLDYIYDLGTKYSFAFEIYEKGQYKRQAGQSLAEGGQGSCLLQKSKPTHAHDHSHDDDTKIFSDPILRSQAKRQLLAVNHLRNKVKTDTYFPDSIDVNNQMCLNQFNPITVKQYKKSMKNWVSAYLELVQSVNEHHIKQPL